MAACQRRHFSPTAAPSPLLLGDEQRPSTPTQKRQFARIHSPDVLRIGELPAPPNRSARKLLPEGMMMRRSSSASDTATSTPRGDTLAPPRHIAQHLCDGVGDLLRGGGAAERSVSAQTRQKQGTQLQSPGLTSFFGNELPLPPNQGVKQDANARQTASTSLRHDSLYCEAALSYHNDRPSRRSIVSPREKESPPWALDAEKDQALRSTSLQRSVQTGRRNVCGGPIADGFSQSSPSDARMEALAMDRRGRQSLGASEAMSSSTAPWEKDSTHNSRSPSRAYEGTTPPYQWHTEASSLDMPTLMQSKRRQSPQSIKAMNRSPAPFALHVDPSPSKVSIAGVGSPEEMRVWVVSCMQSHVEASRLEANKGEESIGTRSKRVLTPRPRRRSVTEQRVHFDSRLPQERPRSVSQQRRQTIPGKVPIRSDSGQTLTDCSARVRSSRHSLTSNGSTRSLSRATSRDLRFTSHCSSRDSLKIEGERISKGYLNMAKVLGDDVQQQVEVDSLPTPSGGPDAGAGSRSRSNSCEIDSVRRDLRRMCSSPDISSVRSRLGVPLEGRQQHTGSSSNLGELLVQKCAERIEQLQVEYRRCIVPDTKPHKDGATLLISESCTTVKAASEASTEIPA